MTILHMLEIVEVLRLACLFFNDVYAKTKGENHLQNGIFNVK